MAIVRINTVCPLDGRHSNFRFHNDLQNVLYIMRYMNVFLGKILVV